MSDWRSVLMLGVLLSCVYCGTDRSQHRYYRSGRGVERGYEPPADGGEKAEAPALPR